MNNRIDAIYARQSVDKKDSISIESQIEFCKYELKDGNCGYALMSIVNRVGRQYLRCTKRLDNKSCVGCGKIYTAELETVVYQQMEKKLVDSLTGANNVLLSYFNSLSSSTLPSRQILSRS